MPLGIERWLITTRFRFFFVGGRDKRKCFVFFIPINVLICVIAFCDRVFYLTHAFSTIFASI